jgi:hypothetical protein
MVLAMFKIECPNILQQNNYVQNKNRKLQSKKCSRDFKFKLKNKNELKSKFNVLNKFNSKLKPDNVTNKLVVTTHYSLKIIPFIM